MIDLLIVSGAVLTLIGLIYYVVSKTKSTDELVDEFGITDEKEIEAFKKL